MFEITRLNLIIMAFLTGYRLRRAVKSVMACGTGGVGFIVLAVVEKHGTSTASQIESVSYNRFLSGHATDNNCCSCSE